MPPEPQAAMAQREIHAEVLLREGGSQTVGIAVGIDADEYFGHTASPVERSHNQAPLAASPGCRPFI